jgi:hypothetical protein
MNLDLKPAANQLWRIHRRELLSHRHISRLADFQSNLESTLTPSVAVPGCLSRIPEQNFFYPGSEFFHPGSREYFNQKNWFISSRKDDPGCSSRMRILFFLPIPNFEVKKAPDPGSGSASLLSPNPMMELTWCRGVVSSPVS